ncbi:hypothetical protein [Labilithrix luteola]|uniref:hypothetical protein n=1 Tax=Labilithrix luteola TaxID=1391654 RepID=UPI0011BA7628|nr:hypothetical protein [Labilithrix luteola]
MLDLREVFLRSVVGPRPTFDVTLRETLAERRFGAAFFFATVLPTARRLLRTAGLTDARDPLATLEAARFTPRVAFRAGRAVRFLVVDTLRRIIVRLLVSTDLVDVGDGRAARRAPAGPRGASSPSAFTTDGKQTL